MHVLCVPSTDSPNSLPIFDDKQTILISNNTVLSTYDFSVQQRHEDANNLQMGNYVVFKDKYKKTRMYTLVSYDGDDLTRTWHAEDVGLDLINETANKWDYTGQPHTIEWYLLNNVIDDSGWTIGINEIPTLTRALKFEGQSDSKLRRMGDVANQFGGAEIDFTIEMNGSAITKQVVNIYKKVGTDLTEQRFIDTVNLKSLQSSGSIANLCTAMLGLGSNLETEDGSDGGQITFTNESYDDGRYYSPVGQPYIFDREARQQWSRFRGYGFEDQGEFDGYIDGIYNYETKDPKELLNRTLTELKKRNTPSETFEANLLDIKADVGDMVQIAHNNYNPPVYLSARVEQVENCYTANGQDTGILGDYQRLQSQIDPRIQDMIDALKNQIKANYTWIRYAKDNKGTGMTATPTTDTKYIAIVSNMPTAVPSDDPQDYKGKWQLIQGLDGKDGIPGQKGENGKTSYTHIAYANNVSGTADFSLDDPSGRAYMGVYVDFIKEDSTNPDLYAWSLTKGESGADGMQGAQGPKGDIGIPGKPGADGKTSYTHVAYADNDKGGGFSQTPANKPYMGWYTDFTANDSTDPNKYAWSLIKGTDGANGAPGKAGADGKTPYFHQAWADSKDGKMNFSTTDPTNRGYLGTYTDFTQADSNDPSKYNWIELVGNLQVGVRNLLKGTADFSVGMANGAVITSEIYNGNKVLHEPKLTADNPYHDPYSPYTINNATGNTYALSFYARTDADSMVMRCFFYSPSNTKSSINSQGYRSSSNDGLSQFTLTKEWKQYWVVWETNANTTIKRVIIGRREKALAGSDTGSIFINSPMLVEGNKAVGWQRAPEDVDDTIASIGTPNLVYNAGFIGDYKVGLDGWIMEGSNKYYMTNATLYNGNHSGAINVKATVDQWWVLGSKPITVAANSKISFSGVSFTGSGSNPTYVGAEIGCYDSSGKHFANAGGLSIPMTKNTWTAFKSENITLPAGTARISFRYTTHVQPNNQINQYISQPMMVVGEHTVPFKDNQGSGSDITHVNDQLNDTNAKIAAVPKVDVQAAAPTSPKKGDQWWVKDASNHVTAFKTWDGSKWVDSTIQQSLLNIVTLNAVTINGSTINGSKFTNNFDFTNKEGIHFQGVTTIANGKVDITWKLPTNNQTGHTYMDAAGFESVINDAKGTPINSIFLRMGQLDMITGKVVGTLNAQDAYRASTQSIQYLSGWGDWGNGAGLITVSRNGRLVTLSGYPKHNGTPNFTNIAQLPEWAKPAHDVNLPAMSLNGSVVNPMAAKLVVNTNGVLSATFTQQSGYVAIGASYFGKDL